MYEASSCTSEDERGTTEVDSQKNQLAGGTEEEKQTGVQVAEDGPERQRRTRSRRTFVSLTIFIAQRQSKTTPLRSGEAFLSPSRLPFHQRWHTIRNGKQHATTSQRSELGKTFPAATLPHLSADDVDRCVLKKCLNVPRC
jgi:hypothetical protein